MTTHKISLFEITPLPQRAVPLPQRAVPLLQQAVPELSQAVQPQLSCAHPMLLERRLRVTLAEHPLGSLIFIIVVVAEGPTP